LSTSEAARVCVRLLQGDADMVKVKGNNFCDSLGKRTLRYAVLSKENRIQVLVNPTPRQLRKRGKRQWHLVQAIDAEGDASQTLQSVLEAVLHDMELGERSNGKN
jgi:hypothetical protein